MFLTKLDGVPLGDRFFVGWGGDKGGIGSADGRCQGQQQTEGVRVRVRVRVHTGEAEMTMGRVREQQKKGQGQTGHRP